MPAKIAHNSVNKLEPLPRKLEIPLIRRPRNSGQKKKDDLGISREATSKYKSHTITSPGARAIDVLLPLSINDGFHLVMHSQISPLIDALTKKNHSTERL